MPASTFAAVPVSSRRGRWAVQKNPNTWVDSDEQPLHAIAGRSLELGQALLRASSRLHQALMLAGFARSQPVRQVQSSMDGTLVTDAFLLGLDETRLQGGLQLEIGTHGSLTVSLILQTAVDPDSFERPTRLFEVSQSVGRVDWELARFEPNSYSRHNILEQLEALAISQPETLLPTHWTDALLDAMVP